MLPLTEGPVESKSQLSAAASLQFLALIRVIPRFGGRISARCLIDCFLVTGWWGFARSVGIGNLSLLFRTKQERNEMKWTRITVNSDQMGGVPCIRGLRIPVATIVGMVADQLTNGEILKAYPDLEADDVREALNYAAEAVRERELPVVTSR